MLAQFTVENFLSFGDEVTFSMRTAGGDQQHTEHVVEDREGKDVSLLRAAAIYAERFADADGRVRATFEMAWLSGWAPHESQQKPLPPGSAKMRLADALGVAERGRCDGPVALQDAVGVRQLVADERLVDAARGGGGGAESGHDVGVARPAPAGHRLEDGAELVGVHAGTRCARSRTRPPTRATARSEARAPR